VPDRFEDERGVIQDLLVRPDAAVTLIETVKGAIRGNHVHDKTVQFTYILSGLLRVVTQRAGGTLHDHVYKPGEVTCEDPGTAHAWEALEDTRVLVFTHGPRSGDAYESDTRRLTGDDRLIR